MGLRREGGVAPQQMLFVELVEFGQDLLRVEGTRLLGRDLDRLDHAVTVQGERGFGLAILRPIALEEVVDLLARVVAPLRSEGDGIVFA